MSSQMDRLNWISPNHHAGICSQRLDITMQEFALKELIISILYNSVLPLKWISLLGTLSSQQGWVEGKEPMTEQRDEKKKHGRPKMDQSASFHHPPM